MAVDVVWVLLAMAVLMFMPVIMAMMMVIVPAVRVFVRFLVQPALDVGVLGLGIVEAGIQDLVGIDLARRDLVERRAGIELVQATLERVERAWKDFRKAGCFWKANASPRSRDIS